MSIVEETSVALRGVSNGPAGNHLIPDAMCLLAMLPSLGAPDRWGYLVLALPHDSAISQIAANVCADYMMLYASAINEEQPVWGICLDPCAH